MDRVELKKETNKGRSSGHGVDRGLVKGWWRHMKGQKGTAGVEEKGGGSESTVSSDSRQDLSFSP